MWRVPAGLAGRWWFVLDGSGAVQLGNGCRVPAGRWGMIAGVRHQELRSRSAGFAVKESGFAFALLLVLLVVAGEFQR